MAVVKHLAASLDVPVDVVCSLVAPMDTLGLGDGDAPADLFDRTFNGRVAEIERAVVRGSGFVAPSHRGHRVLTARGDLLAPRNTEFRRRLVRALGLSEADLGEVVRRFRSQLPHPAGGEPVRRRDRPGRALAAPPREHG